LRWKPLFAVLLGLLMIGVMAGNVNASAIPPEKAQPQDAGGYWEYWEVESVTYLGEYYDPDWTSCASTPAWGGNQGDYVVCYTPVTVSNRYYGNLKVTVDALSIEVGFDVTQSFTRVAGYHAIVQYDGQYVEVFYADVYDKYRVIQRHYVHIDGQTYAGETATVYALEWKRFYFPVIRRDGNIQ